MNNPTVVFPSTRQIAVEDRPMPACGEGEVLIRTQRSLISTGTELTILSGDYEEGSAWMKIARFPFVPGYSNVGEVVDAGPGVNRQWVGRRVATYGSHALFVKAKLAVTRPVQREIADDHASFFTIAEIVMNGVRRGGVTWGEAVAVYGMGLLGQLTARFCRLAGARSVFCIDTADARLARVPSGGGFIKINPRRDDPAAAVRQATRDRMADVAFEVTGNPAAIPGEFAVLRRGGRMVILSSPRGRTTFDFHDLCNAPSFTIIGAHNYSHPEVPTNASPWTQLRHGELFFDLVADGDIDVEPLISHRRPFADAPELYRMLMEDRSEAMGVVMAWDGGA